MHNMRSVSVAKLADVFSRSLKRPKTTGERPSAPLGSRFLTNSDDVFKHNMWDHVQWTEEDKETARQKAEGNSCVRIPLNEQGTFDTDARQYWDRFYKTHQDKFFKDRKWLFSEFPELLPSGAKSRVTHRCPGDQHAKMSLPTGCSIDPTTGHHQHSGAPVDTDTSEGQAVCEGAALENNDAAIQTPTFPGQQSSFRIFEVGCGVGNSVFPITESIKETDAFLYCCDFSPRAIQLVKDHPDYDDSLCHAFVHDVCEEMATFPFPPQSLDVILAVFVFSSIHPERLQGVVNRLATYLKNGGIFLFRDYGRYDFSQLRFKKGRCLSENFYTRGDGTCVYFFTKEEVHNLFCKAGLQEIQNLEDRRLQVNRGKKVVMHRVWMQSKYQKSHPAPPY